ncbi:MAG TPA: undecaprenyl-diphosphate phosphatase [Elusimicrobiales bacterium]|nr:undecaprenyl-diphosphate phosphatase [Elusimicrobiales bacterium]
MDSVAHSIILGILQAITEFLPISSSAHLTILPYFAKWQYQGLGFDVALHFGSLVGVLFYFRKDWIEIIGSAFSKVKKDNSNMLWFLVLATVPGALAGLFLEGYAETIFRNPRLIATTLIAFALILYAADKKSAKNENAKFDLKSALLIGLFQAMAIVPGVSRSGITITVALILGFTRNKSAKISFLLSTPIILGAVLFEFKNFTPSQINPALIIGFLASAVTSWLAIKFLLNFVKKHPFNIFVIYRIILGICIVIFSLIK